MTAAAPAIVDAHNDLLLELVVRRAEENPFRAHWLPKLRAGGVVLQVCPLYAADAPAGEAPARVRAQVEQFERALRENPDDVFQVRSRADLAQVGRDGRIGLMLSMEGVEGGGRRVRRVVGRRRAHGRADLELPELGRRRHRRARAGAHRRGPRARSASSSSAA